MKKTVPKYIQEDFDGTQEQWDRWLAFVEESKKAFTSSEKVIEWFESLKEIGTGTSASMHSTSSNTTAWVGFKWAFANYHSSEYHGCSYSLVMVRADCDIDDILHLSFD